MRLPSLARAMDKLDKTYSRVQVCFQLRPEELEELRKRAKDHRKTVSAYIRDCTLSPNPFKQVNEAIAQFAPAAKSDAMEIDLKSVENESVSHELKAKSIEEIVSERIGHQTGCNCFACERLREMLKT
jgi:ATP-dependent Clp protease ATP-binding subunit ClpA